MTLFKSFSRRDLWPWALALACQLLWLAGCESEQPKPAAGPTLVSDADLKRRLDDVIASARERHMDPQVNNAWQIVHGALAYGDEFKLRVDGKLVPGIEWILNDGKFNGWKLVPGEKGLDSIMEPGNKVGEGHEDQWLGYLSQSGVPLEHPVIVAGQKFKVRDMLTQSQWDVHDAMEATWTLMALGNYLPYDTAWKAKDGHTWSIERLVSLESAQVLGTSACGGTHRMYGLATTLNHYRRSGKPLTGAWVVADKKIRDAIEAAHRFQQPDGSFSANYFERSAVAPEIATRISTTGHVFEFLTVSLSDDELRQPWVTRAAVSLVELFEATRDLPLECGALYHAAHGLRIYRERRFGGSPLPGVTLPPGAAGAEPAKTAAN
jgi:hypothetical protein